MQKKHAVPDGFRLMIWGAILFLMILVAALILDGRAPEVVYRDAVLVSAGGRA